MEPQDAVDKFGAQGQEGGQGSACRADDAHFNEASPAEFKLKTDPNSDNQPPTLPGPPSELINLQLRKHQISTDWDLRSLAEFLHQFALLMILEFKLEVPVPPLSFPTLRNHFGDFHPGRTPVGLSGEI